MIQLLAMTEADLDLRIASETDPAMMVHLGGPLDRQLVVKAHFRTLQAMAEGRCWWFKIVPDGVVTASGTIGIWQTWRQDLPINEMGWMILPPFQNRGIGTEAGRQILARAKEEQRFRVVDAFPAVTNAASNALCAKLGFSKLEPVEVEYAGRMLFCNHWRIDLY